jgi:DNA-binding transcriptional regulator YhcF (GntR family)
MPRYSDNDKKNHKIRLTLQNSDTPIKDLKKMGISHENAKKIVKKYISSTK